MKHKKRSATNPLLPNEQDFCVLDGKRKKKYRSQDEAAIHAPVRTLEQYICAACGFWHNGQSKRLYTK